MKKIIAFIIAVMYFTASSGVVLNIHYCMGKISSVKVDNFAGSFCKCGKKASKGSCCSSEFKVVKISDEYHSTVSTVQANLPVAVLPAQVSLIDINKTISQVVSCSVAKSPPPISSTKIYLDNRVFRI